MDGLIIKHKWLDLILKGQKTIEVRGCDTKKQGEMIYLLESRTSKVVGTCKITATYPISCSDWSEEREKHCVDIPYAWVLEDVKPLDKEMYYKHPKGAVIWVKNVDDLL